MDTKKLRQKILDLAIHGRLVPQCPDDEPAALLLQRIREEKLRLIATGKIKRARRKEDAEMGDAPFEVPESWVWCTLGDVCDCCLGKMLDKAKNRGKSLQYLRNANVRWGNFDLSDMLSMPFEDNEIERYSIKKGDIVICEGGEPGRCAIWESDNIVMFQKALHRVRCLSCILPIYLTYILRLYASSKVLDNYFTGSTIKHLTGNSLVSLPIPLPPLEEQRRIVKEIEHWFKWIEQIEQGKAHLQDAVKAAKAKILDLAIHGKLVPQCHDDEHAEILLKRINPDAIVHHEEEVPKGWCNTILGELFFHNTGKALNSSNREGEVRKYLTTSNVYWDRFELDAVKEMPFKQKELEKCTVTKGDLLVCEGGDIGRSAIWNYDYDICIQNHIHRLRPKTELCVRFYFYVLMYYKINYMIGGKGIGLLGLSSNELHKIQLPLPPLQEQRRIVARIQQLFAQLDTITESL